MISSAKSLWPILWARDTIGLDNRRGGGQACQKRYDPYKDLERARKRSSMLSEAVQSILKERRVLENEVDALRKENAELRQQLSQRWSWRDWLSKVVRRKSPAND